jgi:hypothetical protein
VLSAHSLPGARGINRRVVQSARLKLTEESRFSIYRVKPGHAIDGEITSASY